MGAVFITGATGFIGGEVLARLLAGDPSERIYSLTRARDDDDAERRGREVLFKLFREDRERRKAAAARVRWVRGDLGSEGLGLAPAIRDEITREADTIIHAAASTQFDLPEDEARRINFDGARRVLALAEETHRRGGLSRLAHVSTAYVAGRRSGRVYERELPGPRGPFNNTYEKTKAEAERMLRERMGELPITVLRPSIVVGSSDTGRTYNFNVLYFPIKLAHRGVLRWCPGRRATTLDIVPVDYVADATIHLARAGEAIGGTFHLTAGEDAIRLRRFLDIIRDHYNQERAKVGREPLPTFKIIGRWRWRLLLWYARRRLGKLVRAQFDNFNLYLPYLLTEKIFDPSEAQRQLEGAVAYPPIETYLRKVAEYAVTREWGRRVSWDPALLESGVWSGTSEGPRDADDPGQDEDDDADGAVEDAP
jgi:nucleoside-diphosphate-sugar epimerase